MKRMLLAGLVLALAPVAAFAAEPDGLVLPPGFHASVVASGLMGIRHLAIRRDGVIYASTRGAPAGAGIIALHLGPDHAADHVARFGDVTSGTGIRFYHGALYAASPTAIWRFTFKPGEIVPSAAPVKIVDGMPGTPFLNRIVTFDGKGGLLVSVGGTGNICVAPHTPKGRKPVGLHPCPGVEGRGGVWRFRADKPDQHFPADGTQIATGLRDMDAEDWRRGDALYGIMQDRNGTHATWPELVSAEDETHIAEEMHRIVKGTNMGWPYTYYDGARHVRLMAPEYGGDGKVQPPPGLYATPVVAFQPSHGAPLDLVFYYGRQFPARYRGGAFVIRHGGLGPDLPQGHGGYDILFIPFGAHGRPGAPQTFADGFAGPTPAFKNVDKAAYRPVGGAVGPDGALYVSDSQKGRVWRIFYDGRN